MSEEENVEATIEEKARELRERVDIGALGTVGEGGHPYTSLVEVVVDEQGDFWMLLSDLAVHSENLKRDGRASLLLHDPESGEEDGRRLATVRATFVGEVERIDEPGQKRRERYLEAHPEAEQWMGFSDFSMYRLKVEKTRVVAGFGRIGWIESGEQ